MRDYSYESENFLLRQVKKEDAPQLLRCYSDTAAVALMNDDNCRRGFLCNTLEDMESYIDIWQGENYARPAVIDKRTGEAVGTLEIFGGETGVLRVDLRTDYERPEVLRELYALAVERFPKDFPMGAVVTKAVPEASARRAVLAELGFSGPERFREYEGYYRLSFSKMKRELGIAYCGFACCLCSENADCKGCKQNGCATYAECQNYGCVTEKGLGGCWECPEFPCGKGMLEKPRMRAFVRFAKEHGEQGLLERLAENERAGIVYHYPGGLTGDYDLENEQEILDRLEYGRKE